MESIIHLNDGEGRAICRKDLNNPELKNWEDREEVTCYKCNTKVMVVGQNFAQLRKISSEITNIQKRIDESCFEYEKTDLQRQKKLLERSEQPFLPKTFNDAYLLSEIASDFAIERSRGK